MSIQFCVSEQEAKRKTCPQSMARETSELYCLGSTCMAWRWVTTHINDGPTGQLVPSSNTHGYCGLAGVPRDAGGLP